MLCGLSWVALWLCSMSYSGSLGLQCHCGFAGCSASCTVGTCLWQHRCISMFCTAPCCTAPSVSTVQSAWTLTSRGSSGSQKAYHHHDSHDALCRHRHLRRQCRHSLQRSTIMCSLTSRVQKALCRSSPIHGLATSKARFCSFFNTLVTCRVFPGAKNRHQCP